MRLEQMLYFARSLFSKMVLLAEGHLLPLPLSFIPGWITDIMSTMKVA